MLEEPEIKNIKADLQRMNDELEKKVAERTAELKTVIDELRNEIRERDRQLRAVRPDSLLAGVGT